MRYAFTLTLKVHFKARTPQTSQSHDVVAHGPSHLFYFTLGEAHSVGYLLYKSMLYPYAPQMPAFCHWSCWGVRKGKAHSTYQPWKWINTDGQRLPRSCTLECDPKREAGAPLTVCPLCCQFVLKTHSQISTLPPASKQGMDTK